MHNCSFFTVKISYYLIFRLKLHFFKIFGNNFKMCTLCYSEHKIGLKNRHKRTLAKDEQQDWTSIFILHGRIWAYFDRKLGRENSKEMDTGFFTHMKLLHKELRDSVSLAYCDFIHILNSAYVWLGRVVI